MTRRPELLVAWISALVVAATAFAQQPVQSPIYYLSTAPTLEVGVPVAGELTTASGRNFKDGSYLDVLVLRAVAGEGVELAVESEIFDTYVTVFDPFGDVLDANDDAWEYGDASYTSLLRFEAPATGTYLIVVSGYDPLALGTYTATRQAWVAPEPVVVAVAAPGAYDGYLEAQSFARYLITLDAPGTLVATLRSAEFDTYLTLLVDGVVAAENDDFDGTDSQVVVDLEAGTYEIKVRGFWETDFGTYKLDLDW